MDHGQSMSLQAKLRPTHFHPQNLNYNSQKKNRFFLLFGEGKNNDQHRYVLFVGTGAT